MNHAIAHGFSCIVSCDLSIGCYTALVLVQATFVETVAKLVNNGEITGVSDVRDESDRDGMRVVVELRRGANAEVVVNNLYKQTNLQTTFPCNMVALVDKTPQTLNLKHFLEHFLDFRSVCHCSFSAIKCTTKAVAVIMIRSVLSAAGCCTIPLQQSELAFITLTQGRALLPLLLVMIACRGDNTPLLQPMAQLHLLLMLMLSNIRHAFWPVVVMSACWVEDLGFKPAVCHATCSPFNFNTPL